MSSVNEVTYTVGFLVKLTLKFTNTKTTGF